MDFTSKLSLYDILTQLISGFLILALFIPISESNIKCMCMEDSTETYHWIFVIIFSYLIGIIYHRFLEWIRSKKGEWILLILPILLVGLCQKDIECRECLCCLVMEGIIIVLLIILIISLKRNKEQNRSKEEQNKSEEGCKLTLSLETIFTRNCKDAIRKAKKESDEDYKNHDEYYNTYCSIMNKPAYNTIMFLEAQEAFLRNLTWIVLLYLCASLKDNNIIANEIMSRISCCWILIIFFLILFARYQTQMKIYKAVWDAGEHNNIEKEANDIEKKVNDITENVNRIKKNVDRIKAKVDGIAENVNRIKKRVNRINKRAKF